MAEIHDNIDNVFHRCFSDKNKICEMKVTEHMLLYIFSGEMIVYNDEKKVTIHAGEAAFIRRNHLVRKIKQPAGGKPFNGVFLHLEASFLKRLFQQMTVPMIKEDEKLAKLLYIPIAGNPFLTGYFRSLDQYFKEGIHPTRILMELKLQEVVQILIEQMPKLIPILFDCMNEWKPDLASFMDRNFTSDLSLEQFAHYTGRSLSTFKRDFAELYRETPSRWIIKRRLEKAHAYLEQKNYLPCEVYQLVGFKNFSHFSTAFRKQYGVPPSAV